jgi:hypothetical protein
MVRSHMIYRGNQLVFALMKALAGCLLILTAACVSSPEVVLIGNGRYMVTGRASGPLNAGKDTMEAAKAAKTYCAKQSKQMVIRNIESVSVTFSCETKQLDI